MNSRARRWATPVLLAACPLLAALCIAAPAHASIERLRRRLAAAGFESVAAESTPDGARVWLENRRFRRTGFALGVVAEMVREESPGAADVVMTKYGVPAARLQFQTSAFAEFRRDPAGAPAFFDAVRVAVLPTGVPGPAARRTNSAAGHFDVIGRVLLDSQFGHIQEPFDYHLELSPAVAGQLWRGSRAQVAWTFPIQHARDIPADEIHPDYHESRPEETDLLQFLRLPGRGLGSVEAGYFGGNRYGVTGGAAWAVGARWLVEGSADLSGSVQFRPDLEYSDPTRLTFTGAVTCHFTRPDVAVAVRGGRYLYGTVPGAPGEYAMRLEVNRRFGHLGVGLFGVLTETNEFAGFRLGLPLPPSKRLRPGGLRPDIPTEFAIEYRTEEGPFQVPPTDPRLRSGLLEDFWPGSVLDQLPEWVDGARWAEAGGGPDDAAGPRAPGETR